MLVTCSDCGKDFVSDLDSCPFCSSRNPVDQGAHRRERALQEANRRELEDAIRDNTSDYLRNYELDTLKENAAVVSVLYCIVLYCIVLYCIVLYCIVLYCIVLFGLAMALLTSLWSLSADSFDELRAAAVLSLLSYLVVIGGVGWVYVKLNG